MESSKVQGTEFHLSVPRSVTLSYTSSSSLSNRKHLFGKWMTQKDAISLCDSGHKCLLIWEQLSVDVISFSEVWACLPFQSGANTLQSTDITVPSDFPIHRISKTVLFLTLSHLSWPCVQEWAQLAVGITFTYSLSCINSYGSYAWNYHLVRRLIAGRLIGGSRMSQGGEYHVSTFFATQPWLYH